MKRVFSALALLFLGLSWAVFSGCAGTSRPATFYMLDGVPEAGSPIAADAGSGLSLVLGPIRLPSYLDRAQIVTRTGGNELAVDEFHRWAEPMKDGIYRVLQENLSALLGTAAVYAYPEQPRSGTPLQVVIEVTRFDTSEDGKTTLVAFWTLKGGPAPGPEAPRKSAFTAQAAAGDYGARVRTQNQLLAEFSREIAAAIR